MYCEFVLRSLLHLLAVLFNMFSAMMTLGIYAIVIYVFMWLF